MLERITKSWIHLEHEMLVPLRTLPGNPETSSGSDPFLFLSIKIRSGLVLVLSPWRAGMKLPSSEIPLFIIPASRVT